MSLGFNTRSNFRKENGFSAAILYEKKEKEVCIERIDVYGSELNLEKYSLLIEDFSRKLDGVTILSIRADNKMLERILSSSDDWVDEGKNCYKKIL